MTSKNSYSKGGTHRGMWAIVLCALGILLTQFLPTVMGIQNGFARIEIAKQNGWYDAAYWKTTLEGITNILSTNPAVSVIISALAVVCGISGFMYLHSRQQVDFYHSMPASRAQLFAKNYLSGIVRVIPAYVIVTLLSVLCTFAMGMGEAVVWSQIGTSVLSNTIVFLLIYSMSALATIVCGNTIISLLLLAWMMFGPMAVTLLKSGLCSYFFKTYVFDERTNAIFWTPLVAQFMLGSSASSQAAMQQYLHASLSTVLLVYLAAFLILSALAFFAFRIRKSERAGTALSFEPIKLPVKVLMCAVVGLATGLLLALIGGASWMWVGLLIGTFLFHAVIEMIYAFDFRAALAKPIHLVCILAALVVLVLGMKNDVLGYDQYVPALDRLTGVNFSSEYYTYGGSEQEPDMLRSAENIAAVQRLAEISTYVDTEEAGGRSYQVKYRLSGGKIETRNLMIPETEETDALCEQVFLSEEYKRTQWDLFRYEPEQYQSNYLQMRGSVLQTTLEDTAKITSIISTLREEALARSASARPVDEFWVNGNNDAQNSYNSYYSANIIVTDQDVRTLALLKEYLGYEPQTQEPRPLTVYFEIAQDVTLTADVTDPTDLQSIWEKGYLSNVGEDHMLTQAGIMVDRDAPYVSVTESSVAMFFPRGQLPTAVFEKYRAKAVPYDTTAQSEMVYADMPAEATAEIG